MLNEKLKKLQRRGEILIYYLNKNKILSRRRNVYILYDYRVTATSLEKKFSLNIAFTRESRSP